MGLRTLGCALLSIPVLVIAWTKLPPRPVLYGAISIAFCTGIQALAFSLLSQALRSILYLHEIDLCVLVAFTTLISHLFSIVAYSCAIAGKPFSAPFFETTALLITLIMLGRTIAAATRRSTRSALRELEKLQPNDVLLLPAKKGAQPQPLDARLLHYGDIIRVLPESLIATDGLVVSGSSDVDESSITGESVALAKQKGNSVLAGTLNLSGTLEIQVTRLVHENSLSRITTLVKQAQLSNSPIQDLADKLSAWILPAASFSACMAFLVWILVGLYVHHLSRTSSAVQALTYAIAVFVVSCPCAIGLAVRPSHSAQVLHTHPPS
jgi:Cu2+-exporting ATPase